MTRDPSKTEQNKSPLSSLRQHHKKWRLRIGPHWPLQQRKYQLWRLTRKKTELETESSGHESNTETSSLFMASSHWATLALAAKKISALKTNTKEDWDGDRVEWSWKPNRNFLFLLLHNIWTMKFRKSFIITAASAIFVRLAQGQNDDFPLYNQFVRSICIKAPRWVRIQLNY